MLDDLKSDVTEALTGELRSAVLWQYSEVDDGFGNLVPVYDTPHDCEAVRGSYKAELAGLSGIPRDNAKIEILASSLSVEPVQLDIIEIEDTFWLIENIERDPAGALWVCEGQQTTDPDA